MDIKQFSVKATGELLKLQTKAGWAFVPEVMPPKWKFPESMWPLLVEARTALAALNGIGQSLDEPELLLKPLQNREALTSSSLEGTYVTPEQLLMYELDPREPKASDDRVADWKEVFNYSNALRHGAERLSSLPLCSRLIKEMHAILMHGVRGRNKAPGEFRKWQVQIGSDARFVPPPASHVDDLMTNLDQYMNKSNDYDPLVRCYIVHYQFETIHPFGDGNGRVGRSLLALMISHLLGHTHPWLYMSAFYEKYRDEYVSKMFNVSTEGSWEEWIEFCLRGTLQQARDSIARCKKFRELKKRYQEDAGTLTPRTYKIIEGLFTKPLVWVTHVAEQFSVSYPTAKSDLDRLVDADILRELPDSRPKAYYAPDVMKAAYHEGEEDD
ncbi:MAG: Fic family protein [Planctomycetales bacterium]|nr:Fic family protein [Planctomycetales bacterium]